MDSEAETWKRISYCLLRRLLGPDAAMASMMLEHHEMNAAEYIRGDWDTDEAGRVLVSFESNRAGS